jgi:hypothetical protein
MYSVFTKLGDGEFIFVASHEELAQAAQLVKKLNEDFPHEYVVRDSKGADVETQNA